MYVFDANCHTVTVSPKDYPKRKDWREEGAVNPVVYQGICSVWPFPSLDNMEGVYKVAHGELPRLSSQQLIDCDHDCTIYQGIKRCNDGCTTGLTPNAMSYAVREGMTTEDEYPSSPSAGTCKYSHTGKVYKFKSYYQVNGTEEKMVAALNDVGPITAGVDATQWQFYSGGVFNTQCGTTMNHLVAVVGYDSVTSGGKELQYWIIKNSWGQEWGEKGYIRLARGMNECQVNDYVFTIVA